MVHAQQQLGVVENCELSNIFEPPVVYSSTYKSAARTCTSCTAVAEAMMSLQHDEATNGICTAASRSYKWYMHSSITKLQRVYAQQQLWPRLSA